MKKNLTVTILLVFLVVMNGVLLFLLLKKPDNGNRPSRDLIPQRLEFSQEQEEKFRTLDGQHHDRMRRLDRRSMHLKKYLFDQLDHDGFTDKELDSVTNLLGKLSVEKEKEVFTYFNSLKEICTQEQMDELRLMLSGALRPGPESRGRDPRRGGGRPEPMGPPPGR